MLKRLHRFFLCKYQSEQHFSLPVHLQGLKRDPTEQKRSKSNSTTWIATTLAIQFPLRSPNSVKDFYRALKILHSQHDINVFFDIKIPHRHPLFPPTVPSPFPSSIIRYAGENK